MQDPQRTPAATLTPQESEASFPPLSRRTFLVLAAGGGAALLTGCGGSGGGGSQPPAGANRASGTVTGRIWKDSAGNLLLVRDGATPPAGATVVSGAVAKIASGGPGSRTDAAGKFLLQQVPAGLRKLQLENAGMAPAMVSVTVVGDATVDVGLWTVTRASAIDKVKRELTAAGLTDLTPIRIYGPQQPLPAGVLVVPRLDAVEIDASVPEAKTIAAPSWFFYCDLTPGQPFAHPVLYVYVDAVSGAVTTENRTSWPTLNKQHFYPPITFDPSHPDMVQAGRVESRAAASATAPFRNSVKSVTRNATRGKVLELGIYGFLEGDSALNIEGMLGHADMPTDKGVSVLVSPWDPRFGGWLKDHVIEQANRIVSVAGMHDFLLVDINSHGNLTKPNGDYYMCMPGPEFSYFDTGTWSSSKEMLRPAELGIERAASCEILIIAGTCYSGNWIPFAEENLDLQGKEVTAFCTSPAQRVSYGRLAFGEGGRNAWFFREEVAKEAPDAGQAGLLAAAGRAVTLSQDYFNNNLKLKSEFKDAEASYAVFWSRSRQAGEECSISISPLTGAAAVNENLLFEITLNNRRPTSPPARIKVSTTLGELTGASTSGVNLTMINSGTVSFKSSKAGKAVITAEAFDVVGGSEMALDKVTATVNVSDERTEVVSGTPGIEFGAFYVDKYGFWAYRVANYVAVKKLDGAKFYNLRDNGAPEHKFQDTVFTQAEIAHQQILEVGELVAKIEPGEYWHYVTSRGRGGFSSREKAVADYNKHPIDPNDPFFKTKWSWTARF